MKNLFYLALITLAEATIGVFVKLAGDAIPVFTLNCYRVGFAFLFLLATVPFIKRDFWEMDRDDIKPLFFIGLFIALQISLFNIAMTLAPIANVVIFWSVAPFFVFIFSWFFLKEKARKSHILIFIIALAGIFIAKPLKGTANLGNAIALCSGLTYAAMVTYMRYEGRDESPSMVVWYMAVATLLLSPALFIFGPGEVFLMKSYPAIGVNLPIMLWVMCLGVFSTGVAYLFISLVLQHISANVYSLVDIIVSPVVAAAFGYLVFNEVPSINLIFGGILLLASGFWLSWDMQNRERT
ncbi:MAG: DMT family transporter [Desulfobacterales bacterium]|nr:DMT family transporter [Desulfobacterales bacterium]